MKKRMFRCTENNEFFTLESLQEYFENWLANDATVEEKEEYKENGFSAWLRNCTNKNGSLEEIYKYSMTVCNDNTDKYFDIVAIGRNHENACDNYEIDNNYEEYSLIPIDWRIIPW